MDSLSQIALGAAVGVAVMGRRTAVWKAALWGAVAGTLPDLDALIDHGDPIANMTLHRTESHAPFYLTVAAPLLAGVVAWLHGEARLWRRWWLAIWLALVTHPLLDTMTVYGTQLGLPFTDHPWAVGSIFIIDPLYTLPLLVGVAVALARPATARGLRWNAAGLAVSTAYLAWGVAVQHHVGQVARTTLAEQGVQATQLLVTPTPFNTVLWRVVALTPQGYSEGFYSLLDAPGPVRFDAYPRGMALWAALGDNPPAARLAWFTQGFYKMDENAAGTLRISDLRMGLEPHYSFAFAVAERRADGTVAATPPRLATTRPDIGATLAWMGRRLRGDTTAGLPPR